jgi:hypothetical protein
MKGKDYAGMRLMFRRAAKHHAGAARRAILLATIIVGVSVLLVHPSGAQDDEWSVVSHREERSASSHPAPIVPQSSEGVTMICGEPAVPAHPAMTGVVSNIDRLWGINTPVYETVRAEPPHVSPAGCIFYNVRWLAVFLHGETDQNGELDNTPMIYAIMAHEIGHLMHHDFSRPDVPSVTKELEADRFAGYTLSRLGLPRDNITPFYSLGGDEFSGVHDHGFSDERVAAFDNGWKLAEWNRPENSSITMQGAQPGLSKDVDPSPDASPATTQ